MAEVKPPATSKPPVLIGEAYLQKERERKRDYYAAHRDEIKARKLEKYHERRQKMIEAGVAVRGRGRPRKEYVPPETPAT